MFLAHYNELIILSLVQKLNNSNTIPSNYDRFYNFISKCLEKLSIK